MLRRILIILLVVVVVFSFSTAALAGSDTDSEGTRLVRDEDGKLVEVYLPQAAKENANDNSRAAKNPIDVAGKKMM